jgi:hypothetical protein
MNIADTKQNVTIKMAKIYFLATIASPSFPTFASEDQHVTFGMPIIDAFAIVTAKEHEHTRC